MIDGEKLLDLLIGHGIGIKKRPVELWEVDAAALEEELETEVPEADSSIEALGGSEPQLQPIPRRRPETE